MLRGYRFINQGKPPIDPDKPGLMVLETLGIRIFIDRKNKSISYGGASKGTVSPGALVDLGNFFANVGGMAGALEEFAKVEFAKQEFLEPDEPTLGDVFPVRMEFSEKAFRYWLATFESELDVSLDLLRRKIQVEPTTVHGVRLLDALCASAFNIVPIPGVMYRRILLGFEGCEFESPKGFIEFLNGKLKDNPSFIRGKK